MTDIYLCIYFMLFYFRNNALNFIIKKQILMVMSVKMFVKKKKKKLRKNLVSYWLGIDLRLTARVYFSMSLVPVFASRVNVGVDIPSQDRRVYEASAVRIHVLLF